MCRMTDYIQRYSIILKFSSPSCQYFSLRKSCADTFSCSSSKLFPGGLGGSEGVQGPWYEFNSQQLSVLLPVRERQGQKTMCQLGMSEWRGTFLEQACIKLSNFLFISLSLFKARTQWDTNAWLSLFSHTCMDWSSFCYEV